jgi:hypothetical protein
VTPPDPPPAEETPAGGEVNQRSDEPLLPIEKRLIVGSLLLGILLLGILLLSVAYFKP